jgi:hypothetical protein
MGGTVATSRAGVREVGATRAREHFASSRERPRPPPPTARGLTNGLTQLHGKRLRRAGLRAVHDGHGGDVRQRQ